MADAATWCIDFAYAEQGCLFVFGWFAEPGPSFQGLLLNFGGQQFDLGRNVIRTSRPDVVTQSRARRPNHDYGVLIAAEIGPELTPETPIELWFVLANGAVEPIGAEASGNRDRFIHFARANLLSLLNLLANVPENQRPRLAAIADRARAPTDTAAIAASDPFVVTLIALPTPDLLLVLGRLHEPHRNLAPIEIFFDDSPIRRRLRLLPGPDGTMQFLAMAEIAPALSPNRFIVAQRVPTGRHAMGFNHGDIRVGLPALDALLLPLDLDTQFAILEDLADLMALRPATPDLPALRRIWLDRADLLPTRLERAAPPLQCVIDQAWQIGPHGVFLSGWRSFGAVPIRSVVLRAPFLPPFDLAANWVADPRHDVWSLLTREGLAPETDELGFTCYVPLALPDPLGALIVITAADGTTWRLRLDITPTPDAPLTAIRAILSSFPETHRALRRLLDHHIGPAIGALWQSRRQAPAQPARLAFGPPPDHPAVSLVVPIWGRWDFIEFQLAEFANDPAMRGQELIYVIDDPSIYDLVRVAAPDLFGCYQLPFTLVYAARNQGFGAATNLGAADARGEYLLLLNSDVLPTAPGWLPALTAAHRAHHRTGAIGPRLLYEDGSLQHGGMRFYRLSAWAGLWVNDHPLKGQPPPEETATRACPALTGACLLMRTELFHALGGLSEDYIVGDFEDSDLCLRLLGAGYTNYYVPSVSLYHLERQSQAAADLSPWRGNLTLYNCWLHNSRWDDAILALAPDA